MGWLGTLLSAANTAANIHSASQLQAMRQQDGQAALVQAIVAHLRDQIFQLKQMAESSLAQEAESPKVAAGAISIVAAQLIASGITPDLFQELGDKEYAMQTIRLIGENKRRLLGQLSADEQAEVTRVVAAVDRLPDYNYYLENYKNGRRLIEAAPTVIKYEGRNGNLLEIGVLLVYALVGLPLSVGISMPIMSAGGRLPWEDYGSGTEMYPTAIVHGLVLAMGVWTIGWIVFKRWQHSKQYRQAKKVVDDLKGKVDLPRFVSLDREFGGDSQAGGLQREAQRTIATLFGESLMLGA